MKALKDEKQRTQCRLKNTDFSQNCTPNFNTWDLTTFVFWTLFLRTLSLTRPSVSDLQSRTCRVQKRDRTRCSHPGCASALAPLSAAGPTPRREWLGHTLMLLATWASLDSEHYAVGTTSHRCCWEQKRCTENNTQRKDRRSYQTIILEEWGSECWKRLTEHGARTLEPSYRSTLSSAEAQCVLGIFPPDGSPGRWALPSPRL